MGNGLGELPMSYTDQKVTWSYQMMTGLGLMGMEIMLVRCRKCGIHFDLSAPGTEWSRVNDIQMMTCGAGGTHRLVGIMHRGTKNE